MPPHAKAYSVRAYSVRGWNKRGIGREYEIRFWSVVDEGQGWLGAECCGDCPYFNVDPAPNNDDVVVVVSAVTDVVHNVSFGGRMMNAFGEKRNDEPIAAPHSLITPE